MYIIIFLLSIWQSILFYEKNLGLSVLLFALPFLIFLIRYLEQIGKIKNKKAKFIAIPILLLSATFFIFNNSFLNTVNIIAIPLLTILMLIELLCDEFTLVKVIRNTLKLIYKPIEFIEVVCKKIFKKLKKEDSNKVQKSENIKRIIKAILISIPLLFVVFVLLISADNDFATLFANVIEHILNLLNSIHLLRGRAFIIVLVFFYLAGFIENIIATNSLDVNRKELKPKDNLSIKFILTILNIMYIVFCIVQIKSLFNIYTMNKNNINYSYYARQGFFQLMVVSAINLFMILKSKKKCYTEEEYINIMDIAMIFLTSIILVSSFIRMYLYSEFYGLTLKRVLVFWAEFTEAILLVPTAMFVLNKRFNLAKTYFIIVTAMYLVLNFANINRMIAKYNVDLYVDRQSVSGRDVSYLIELGTDAVPETVRLLDIKENNENGFNQLNGDYVKTEIKQMYNELKKEELTWQELNISKIRAEKILEGKLKSLK